MISKQTLGYSLVCHLWRNYTLTVSDLFLPLVMKVIYRKYHASMHKTSIPELKGAFKDEYSIDLPILNIVDLLRRDNTGSLTIADDFYQLNYDAFSRSYPSLCSDRREKDIQTLYDAIKSYALKEYNCDNTIEQIDEALSDLLMNNAILVLKHFDSQHGIIEHTETEISRIIAQYITKCTHEELLLISEMFIGKILNGVIGLKENKELDLFESDMQILENCCLYVDTPILIPLLKASDEAETIMYEELINILVKAGASIKVFSHVVTEIQAILNTTNSQLKESPFNWKRATPAALYFNNNRHLIPQLHLLLNDTKKFIENELGFDVVDVNYKDDFDNMIDARQLEDIIKHIYSDNSHKAYFDVMRYSAPIITDVKSISAVQCLRQGVVPQRINDYTHAFLTKNWGLYKATKEYHDENDDSISLVNTIFIDSYLSSTIWNVQQKPNIDRFYQQRLITDCLNVISPTPKFMDLFNEKVALYANKNYLNDEETKLMMTLPDYVTSTYVLCGDDASCIYETVAELKAKNDAKIVKPYQDENAGLKTSLNEATRQKTDAEEELERTKQILEVERQEKASTQKKNEELKGYLAEKENQEKIDKFRKKHFIQISGKYIIQKPVLTELLLGVINLVFAYLTSFYLISVGIVYIILSILFKFHVKMQVKSFRQIAEMEYLRTTSIQIPSQ
ncbi:MAG: hypothetical protein PHY48_12415 [Candidatus Cloacimonetes bacterium]|nr:hypothetical protein [Candidatus Cloacimonadota bacterium]